MCDIMDSNISIFESQNIFMNIVKSLGFTIERDRNGQFRIPKNIEPTDLFS